MPCAVIYVLFSLLFLSSPGLINSAFLVHNNFKIDAAAQSAPPALLSSSSDGRIYEVPTPQNESYPLGITADSNGNIWFAEANLQSIAEYFPSNQSFHTFPIPTAHTQLTMIWFLIFDKNGYLWFADENQPLLWRFDPQNGQFRNYSTSSQQVKPFGLAYDPSSNLIWFTSTYTSQIGSFLIDSSENAVLQGLISLPSNNQSNTGPSGIIVGPKGDVYVSESFVGQISKYDPSTQDFSRVWELPKGSQPVGVYLDSPRNLLWFTDHGSSLFGYVNETSNQVVEFATSLFHFSEPGNQIDTTISLPYWITGTSSGIIWFNEHFGNRIARFDLENMTLTEFQVPTEGSEPLRFYVQNQNDSVWFTEFSGGKIGVLRTNNSEFGVSFVKNQSITLGSQSVEILANAPIDSFNSTSISGTLSRDGYITSNLSISLSSLGSSSTIVTISRGQSLSSGHYSLTLCETNSLQGNQVVKNCSIVYLNVEQPPTILNQYDIYLIAALVVVVAITVSLAYVRRWRF